MNISDLTLLASVLIPAFVASWWYAQNMPSDHQELLKEKENKTQKCLDKLKTKT